MEWRSLHVCHETFQMEEMTTIKSFGMEIRTFVGYDLFWICWQTCYFAMLTGLLWKSFHTPTQIKT